ncbi:hypothetical protein Bca52824_056037 [Brassica carinata]|uniref:Uncharacterized protein n=1 Tax=Brassica carinata TaxID=52824 RepID=A0A8X7RBW0_BRACI|nr:hypothetical protein Bca52824_056037 [Brassica carinata]
MDKVTSVAIPLALAASSLHDCLLMPSVVSLGKQFLLPLPCPVASRRRTPLSLRFPNRRWRSIPSQLEELLNQMEIDFVETKNPAFDRGEEEDVGKLRQGAKLVLELGPCKDCERYQYKSFELNIVFSQVCLAGVSLLCVSHNLRKHGI